MLYSLQLFCFQQAAKANDAVNHRDSLRANIPLRDSMEELPSNLRDRNRSRRTSKP